MDLELSARIQEISSHLEQWQQNPGAAATDSCEMGTEPAQLELGTVNDQIVAMEKIIRQLKAIEESLQNQITNRS